MPRISSPVSSRPDWYDRAPTTEVLEQSQSGLAPHAITVRATYTVPTDRKAALELGSVIVSRRTAAGTPDRAGSFIRISPGAAGALSVIVARLLFVDNDAKDRSEFSLGAMSIVSASDVVTLETQDLSTTGTVDFDGRLKMTEFDA